MRTFLFIDSERTWRGGQAQLFTLIEGLHRRGHTIHLACFPGTTLEARSRVEGITVHPLAIRSEAGCLSLVRLLRTLRRTRPDILAFNTPRPILMGSLASMAAPVGATIIFRRVSFPLRHSRLSRLKYTWRIDRVIAISHSIKSQLEADGVPQSLIDVVYEGIDPAQYPLRPRAAAPPEGAPFTVGTVAALSREKGLDHLIEAASLIPNADGRIRYVIAGEGECREELERQARARGVQGSIRFLGFCEDIRRLLGTMDLFVLPSLSEGLSSAIIEAMASCLPVVASKVGGIPELVRDGDNGLLVPPADPPRLAEAIRRLAGNPEVSARMGLRGRRRVEESFTLDRKILETEKLCDTLLAHSTH